MPKKKKKGGAAPRDPSSPSHRKPPPAAASNVSAPGERASSPDTVEASTETAASAAAALAETLGIREEEAWELINKAASGNVAARNAIASAMEPVAVPGSSGAAKAGQQPQPPQPQPQRPASAPPAKGGRPAASSLLCGEMVAIEGCDSEQTVVLVEGFLSEEEIAHVEATPAMGESIEAGPDGTFKGLVGGNRYTDDSGLSIFGSAKHRSWRIDDSLSKESARLVERLTTGMAAVDAAHWGSLSEAERVQFICEIEYICYDASVPGSRPNLAPHVDNGAKVTIVALLADESDFDGGTNFFGGGANGGARSHRMKRGDALFFRGECVEHWISHVEGGKRSILQVELHLHENKAAAELVQQAEQAKKEGNIAHRRGDMKAALTSYDHAIGMLVHAEREHPGDFGAHLEVKKMAVSCACLLNAAACTLKLGDYQRAVENCSAVLSFDPESAKALFRRAQAHEKLSNNVAAEADLVEALRHKQGDGAIMAALAALRGESAAIEAVEAKEHRRRKSENLPPAPQPPSSSMTSSLMEKVKTGLAGADDKGKTASTNPLKPGASPNSGFNGGSFITAESLAAAGALRQQPSVATVKAVAPSPAPNPAPTPSISSAGTASSSGESSSSTVDRPALRQRSGSSDSSSGGDRKEPPKKPSPKPRVPSPTTETAPEAPPPRVPSPTLTLPTLAPQSQQAVAVEAGGSGAISPGRLRPGTSLGIATDLLAAFDGSFEKALECLLTAHKFA